MSQAQAHIEDYVLVVERKDRRGSAERKEIPHMEPTEEKDFTEKAKEVLHDVAETTMKFAYEMKEKIIGHVIEHDIEKAADRVVALKNRLMNEQQECREIEELLAEKVLNLSEYRQLKEKESKLKRGQFTTEIKILEATEDYDRLKNAQLSQKMQQKLHQKCHEADRKAINADIQGQQHSPQLPAH